MAGHENKKQELTGAGMPDDTKIPQGVVVSKNAGSGSKLFQCVEGREEGSDKLRLLEEADEAQKCQAVFKGAEEFQGCAL